MIIGFAIGWLPIVGIVGGILILVGLLSVFLGRRGFGDDHRRSVVRACILILVGVLGTLAVAGVFAWIQFMVFSSTITGGSTASIGDLRSRLDLLAALTAVFGIAELLAFRWLVIRLADRIERRALWIAFGLGSAIVVLGAGVSILTFSSMTGGPTTLNEYATMTYLWDAAEEIPLLLFAWTYYHIRRSLLAPLGRPQF